MIVTFRSTTSPIQQNSWKDLAYGGSTFFAIASRSAGPTSTSPFSFSPNGDFWNQKPMPINFWKCVDYGAGRLVILGQRNGTLYDGVYSDDLGTTWTQFQIITGSADWSVVKYSSGQWIAISPTALAISTNNALTWTDVSATFGSIWTDLAYGNGRWVAVARTGSRRAMLSFDGFSWSTTLSADDNIDWYSVAFGNGRFVAVGGSFADGTSAIMWSDTGISWTLVAPPVNSLWSSITFGNNVFVAVSRSGVAMESADGGLTWEMISTPGDYRWVRVVFGENTFSSIADFASASNTNGNRSMLAPLSEPEPEPPLPPDGSTLSAKQQIELLASKFGDGTDYIRIVRDGSDYIVTMVGSYKYRGLFKVRRLTFDGFLRFRGPLIGTNGKWLPVSEVRDYENLYTYPFPNNGLDDSPTPPYEPNLTRIVSRYDQIDGYGQFSVEYALEDLKNVNLPEQPSVADAFQAGTNMYNLDAIGAPEAWASGLTGDGIIVAVLDTGVDVTHIELDDNIWINVGEIPGNNIDDDNNGFIDDVNGWDFVNNDPTVEDVDGHGTHVAGTISAENNGIGIVGGAFNAQIMPIKVLPDTGTGGSYFNLAQAIFYAVDNGAHVINMSLGGGTVPPQIIRDAIKYANDNDVICVMAAGNDFEDDPETASSPNAPGSYASEYGIVVGATNEAEDMTTFSNRAGQPVDWDGDGAKELLYVTTSGRTIWSTLPNDQLGTKSGTSMACPLIAAACAILLQADPTLKPDQIRVLLANNTI